jgi:hypothetical protein
MAEMTGRLELRLPPEMLDRIERWRQRQPAPPTKATAIRYIMELGLAEAEKSSGGSGGSRKPERQSVAAEKPPSRKAPRAKPLAMLKEAQIRALRERDTG